MTIALFITCLLAAVLLLLVAIGVAVDRGRPGSVAALVVAFVFVVYLAALIAGAPVPGAR